MTGWLGAWAVFVPLAAAGIAAAHWHDRGRVNPWDVAVMALLWPGVLAVLTVMLTHEAWTAWMDRIDGTDDSASPAPRRAAGADQ